MSNTLTSAAEKEREVGQSDLRGRVYYRECGKQGDNKQHIHFISI